MSVVREIIERSSPGDLAHEAARRFVDLGQHAIEDHGAFYVALSGGSTPKAMYDLLAGVPIRDSLDWSKLQIFFSDERFVPPDSEESNYHSAREKLIANVPIAADRVHPYATVDVSPQDSAKAYEADVRHLVPRGRQSLPAFDLILLGMGPDGHTASLFPGTDALSSTERLVVANYVPQMMMWRLTFTYTLLNASRTVMFLVQGDDKKERVREVLSGVSRLPAAGVLPTDGQLVWLLDSAAAAEVDPDDPRYETVPADTSP